jgi:putative endonuclease
MHYVYILKSIKTGYFYIGETPEVSIRLEFHNDVEKNTNSTKTGIPWEVFWILEVSDRKIARLIEKHIKSMKSTTYIVNLKKFPEISKKLILKYQ